MYSSVVSTALDASNELAVVVNAARAAWPAIHVDERSFLAHLARHAASGTSLLELQTNDLYLACACLQGSGTAIAAFEATCLGAVDDAASRQRLDSDTTSEIKQMIREKVLVGDGRVAPSLATYGGRGKLRSWLYVMATREALALRRRALREAPLDDKAALQAFVTGGDPELESLKDRAREEFKVAFDVALRALPAREQTLLRQHVIDGLGIDQLGALYHVHRSTAARMLERARRAVLEATRSRLKERLDLPSNELDSLLRLIRSRIEVSLRALFRRRRR